MGVVWYQDCYFLSFSSWITPASTFKIPLFLDFPMRVNIGYWIGNFLLLILTLIFLTYKMLNIALYTFNWVPVQQSHIWLRTQIKETVMQLTLTLGRAREAVGLITVILLLLLSGMRDRDLEKLQIFKIEA